MLDDLRWSDAASIELIGALLRRGPRAPVLFALDVRVDLARSCARSVRLSWALCELAYARYYAGHLESAIAAAEGYVRRTEEHAAKLGLRLPTAFALRARAVFLLADNDPLAAAELAKRSAEVAAGCGARLPAAFSLALAGRALDAGGERVEAIAVLRQAESELDACGAIRVRDEMRRELLLLGVPTEPPRPLRPTRRGLAELLRELRGMRGEALQAALGRALGDPDLVVVHAAPRGRCRHPSPGGPSRPSNGMAASSPRSSTTPRWTTIPSSSRRSPPRPPSPSSASSCRPSPRTGSRSSSLTRADRRGR